MALNLNLQKRTPGLGFAGPVRETDTASAAASVVPARQPKAPADAQRGAGFGAALKENPFEVVGLILSNIAAGMRGQELPTERIRREQIAEKQNSLKRLNTVLDLVDRGVSQFANLDPNDPRTIAAIDAYADKLVPTLGEGFRSALTGGIELVREQGRDALNGVIEHQARISDLCGFADRDCILETARDPKQMARFDVAADQELAAGIFKKFQIIADAIRQDPDGNAVLAAISENGITFNELAGLPEGFGFTEDELRAIRRDPSIQEQLGSFGYKTPERVEFEQRELFKDSLKDDDDQTGTFSFGNFIPSDGDESFTARMHNKDGTVEFNDGSGWKPAGKGSFTSQVVQAGSAGELTGGDQSKLVKNLTDRRVSMFQFLKAATRMLKKVEESGDESLDVVGGVARSLNTLGAQLGAASRAILGSSDDLTTVEGSTIQQIGQFAEGLDWQGTIAANSASVRSQITSLAYGLALIKNGTRPTDEDVRNMMKVLAGNAGSGRQLIAATTSAMIEAMDNYAVEHQEILGEPFDLQGGLELHGITLPGGSEKRKLLHLLDGQEITAETIALMDKEGITLLLGDPTLPDTFSAFIQDRMRELGM